MSIYLGNLELATGGGATGTGIPVNSYAPFSVTTTGNPAGYDATTGLYTHQNGDYWLKTGNTLIDSANNYPNATGGPAGIVKTTTLTGANAGAFRGVASDGTDYFIALDFGNTIVKFDGTTGAQIAQAGASSGNENYLGYNATNNTIMRPPNTFSYVVTEVTAAALTGTGFSFTTPQVTRGQRPIAHNSDLDVYYVGHETSRRVYEYSSAGTYTCFNFSVATEISPQQLIGLGYSTTFQKIIVNRGNGSAYAYNTDGTYTGTRYAGLPTAKGIDVIGSRIIKGNNAGAIIEYEMSNTVGDATARTDPDSWQPLFIKIK